jgi:D-alanyl-D-alanine dipeptidase
MLMAVLFVSCKNEKIKQKTPQKSNEKSIKKPIKWVELKKLDSTFVLDMRYATKNNFVHQKMYPCARCFVRPEVANALLKIQNELKSKGLRIKLFDCYRPGKVQKALWKIMPNPSYVADPKKGSMHNRGVAVDLTLVDKNGKELDMGTPFDYFGKKARHAYKNLPKKVLENRLFLKNIMEKHGLQAITSEWWHYSYREKNNPIEQWVWQCKK